MDPNLIFLLLGGGAMAAVVLFNQWSDSKKYTGIAPPREAEPVVSSTTVLQQQRHDPWAMLARAKGWPVESREIDATHSKLSIRWGSQKEAFFIEVWLTHSFEQATSTTRFSLPCLRPADGLLQDRQLLSQALAWQGVESERTLMGKWLTALPGPQELEWEPKDKPKGLAGMLRLSLPAQPGDVSELRAGLRAMRRALREAQAPPWAALAYEQGWHLGFDSTKTLPILAGSLGGVPFRATLRETETGLQTQISSIAVPELLPDLRVVHIEHGDGQGADLNHPIAGSMLHASAPSLTALRLLINNPQVFGALMAVVHAHPGSSLSGDGIELVADRDLKRELLPALQAVAALSVALQDHFSTQAR